MPSTSTPCDVRDGARAFVGALERELTRRLARALERADAAFDVAEREIAARTERHRRRHSK